MVELETLINGFSTAFATQEKNLALLLSPQQSEPAGTLPELTSSDSIRHRGSSSTASLTTSKSSTTLLPSLPPVPQLPPLPGSPKNKESELEREKIEGIVKTVTAQNNIIKDTMLSSFGKLPYRPTNALQNSSKHKSLRNRN